MAKQARQPRVIPIVMFELRVAGLRNKKAQKQQDYFCMLLVLFCDHDRL